MERKFCQCGCEKTYAWMHCSDMIQAINSGILLKKKHDTYIPEKRNAFDLSHVVRKNKIMQVLQRIDSGQPVWSSLTAVLGFDKGYVGMQPVASKQYFAKYWLKELQESMDKCTCHQGKTEIPLKMALKTMQSIDDQAGSFFLG